MKCADLKQVESKYGQYRKRIERLKKKIIASHLSQIVVRDGSIVVSHPLQTVVMDGSISSHSNLTIGSGETPIAGTPHLQVVSLATPSTMMTKVSSVEIETTITTPRHTIRRKTSRRLQQHNTEKCKLKKRTKGAFITATRR